MLQYKQAAYWLSSEELPDSDDTPVDNELQDLIPGLLKAIVAMLWVNRWDWFFGVDMGIYFDRDKSPLVPYGFLSLGVVRFIDEGLRKIYFIEEEKIIPLFILEVVSEKYRGEYSEKKKNYANLGALYYVIYCPHRRRKPKLEVHRLVDGSYHLLPGNPVLLPEIGLGIGAERGTYQGMTREWLYWYNEQGQRFLAPEERAYQAEKRIYQAEEHARIEQERAARLAAKLRELGIDPDTLV